MSIPDFERLLNLVLEGSEHDLIKWCHFAATKSFDEKEINQTLHLVNPLLSASDVSKRRNALTLRAILYQYGMGSPVNELEAIRLYEEAIQLGQPVAMNNRAFIYENAQNYSEAIELYDKAINLKSSAAMTNRAKMHKEGKGGDVNYPEAIRLYEEAIQLGNSGAMNNRAFMHYEGVGCAINYPEAIRLYEKAIKLGNSNAMYQRALMHEEGIGDVINYPEAIRLYEKAIKLGNSSAMNNRASMYNKGIGCAIDYPKAILLYEEAIQLGNSGAMNNRALMHAYAEGGPLNYPEAIRLFKEAIKFGDSDAKTNLNKLYLCIFSNALNNKELRILYLRINEMCCYGENLHCDKGNMIKQLAVDLQNKLDSFIIQHYSIGPSKDEEQTFKAEFKALLCSKNKEINAHRKAWKPIIANIFIALSGVGFVALLAKVTTHAISSVVNKTEFSLNKAFFFAQTRSQMLVKQIEKASNCNFPGLS